MLSLAGQTSGKGLSGNYKKEKEIKVKLEVGRYQGVLTVYNIWDFIEEDAITVVWTVYELGQETKGERIHFSGWDSKYDKIITESVETHKKWAYEIAMEIIEKGKIKES